ncbi:MAG: beta-ketoacyl synthase chain length factor [Porticoccaceae bacterium]|nr:beta-ketoacyl synthase chain length factor [Porticoccaceae bacterium]
MSSIVLTIKDWSAWMPGIHSLEDWQQWAAGQKQAEAGGTPEVSDVPPMLRRRLSSLGKMALSVAFPLLRGSDIEIPCVFSSRHGELERTVGLLKSLAAQEPLSPTHFSLSVHNAIGGVMSIARKDPSSITALAGDIGTTFLEAAAIMDEQFCSEILCIIYDEPVPSIYTDNSPEPEHAYAIAFLLSSEASNPALKISAGLSEETLRHTPQKLTLSICDLVPLSPDDRANKAPELPVLNQSALNQQVPEPQALAFLKYLLSPEDNELIIPGDRHAWRWAKINSRVDANATQ